ncbi:MAG: ribosome maturation factor RimM [Erysipelotrichaceae bacterium]|jgi:16S rRNA processing protein RimM|nr:ribosome maturation factor RimM [Erysipelotrichaceae bacterium]
MDFLTIGHVVGTRGLDGTLKVISTSYFAMDRYENINNFYFVDLNGNRSGLTLKEFSMNGDLHFLKFEQIKDIDAANKYKGGYIQIEKDEAILPEGYYLFSDLVGCNIYDVNNKLLGVVHKVEEYPAQITLRIKKEDGKFFFVPFIDEFVTEVDVKNKKIVIKTIQGML